MDAIYGTLATAIVGGLLITAFVLGPRLAAGSLFEYTDLTSAQMLSALKGELAILEAINRRHQRHAELKSFASGGALVLTGWILAALYCLAVHQTQL